METHKFPPDYTDSHPRINVFLLMLSYIQNTECARHRESYFLYFIIKNSIKLSVLTQLRFITITSPDINETRFSSESRDILISAFSDPKVPTIELTSKCIYSTLNQKLKNAPSVQEVFNALFTHMLQKLTLFKTNITNKHTKTDASIANKGE